MEIYLDKEEIIKEYKRYLNDKNLKADKDNFVNDFIMYYYALGHLKVSEMEKTIKHLYLVLKEID